MPSNTSSNQPKRWAAVDTIRSGKAHLWREAYSEGVVISECGMLKRADELQPNDAIGRCQRCEGSRHA